MQDEQRPEIDLKQAVRIAMESVADLYEAQGYQLGDLLLEEVERSGDQWLVTVGFTRPATGIGSALAGPRRAFKRVRIDAETGRLGMEIRELLTVRSAAAVTLQSRWSTMSTPCLQGTAEGEYSLTPTYFSCTSSGCTIRG